MLHNLECVRARIRRPLHVSASHAARIQLLRYNPQTVQKKGEALRGIPDPLPPAPPLQPLPQLLHAGIRPPWLFRVENFEMKVRA